MSQNFYSFEDEVFSLHEDVSSPEIYYKTSGPQLYFIIDVEEGILFRHGGELKLMTDLLNSIKGKALVVDKNWGNNIRLINVSHWPIEAINRCLASSDFSKIAYRLYGDNVISI